MSKLKLIVGERGGDLTVSQVREHIEKNRGVGIDCPCCGHRCQIYCRHLSAALVRCLLILYYHPRPDHEGWINVKGLFPGGDYAKLRFWELIEVSDSGHWRVTDLGREFLDEKTSVPQALSVYANDVIKTSDDLVLVTDIIRDYVTVREVAAGGGK